MPKQVSSSLQFLACLRGEPRLADPRDTTHYEDWSCLFLSQNHVQFCIPTDKSLMQRCVREHLNESASRSQKSRVDDAVPQYEAHDTEERDPLGLIEERRD